MMATPQIISWDTLIMRVSAMGQEFLSELAKGK
jgi:hypothetical protein